MKEYYVQVKGYKWFNVGIVYASNDQEFIDNYDKCLSTVKEKNPDMADEEFRGIRRETTITDTVLI
jgi:hypothetical protein